MTSASNTYSIDIREDVDLSQIKSEWQKLVTVNNQLSFFHSWEWLETWLHVYKPELLVVSAEHGGETVALGLFGKSSETRHHLVRAHQLRLFQTGNQQKDQIWVEYNDFLCHPDHLEDASNACLKALLSLDFRCDEVVISMIPESRAESLSRTFKYARIFQPVPTYTTNLRQLGDNSESYVHSLSRNTRYQINLSIRKYENLYGPLKLSFANDVAQVLQFWEEAGKLHAERWHDSGFNNPEFVSFHKEFMVNNLDSGMIDVVKITAGNHLIAIIYNIIYRQNVYFYLQGLRYETDGKLKSGLTAHSLLIEHYLQQGLRSYNFMGGYSQYKKQLSEAAGNLVIIKIQKPLIRFRVENMIRNIKQKIPWPGKIQQR